MDALLESSTEEWNRIWNLVQAGLKDGTVKPLPRRVHGHTDLVDALRSANDDNKALIKVTTAMLINVNQTIMY